MNSCAMVAALGWLGVALAAAGLPEPVFETTFRTDAAGAVLDNLAPAANGRLMGAASIVDTVLGKGAAVDGTLAAYVAFPAAEKLRLPSEFTVAGWFCVNAWPPPGADRPFRGYALFSRGGNCRAVASPDGAIGTQTSRGDDHYTLTSAKGLVVPGRWFHAAYTYSVSNGQYALYVNGVQRAARRATYKKAVPAPLEVSAPLSLGSLPNYFPLNGIVGRVRVYAQALNGDRIIDAEQDLARRLLAAVTNGLDGLPGADALRAQAEQAAREDVVSLERLDRLQAEKERLAGLAALHRSGVLGRESLGYSVVNPMAPGIYFRDSALPADGLNGSVLIAAALNEFEPGSFLVKPLRDLSGFLPVIDDLKSAEGGVLPASAIDIRLVKMLVRKGRLLQPSVLLHDDAMVRIDANERTMDMRLSFPEGDRYVRVSQEGEKPAAEEVSAETYPIVDSPEIRPLDLQAGVNQQYWLTLRTDESLRPGLYASAIRLTAEGKTLAAIPLKVRILPFVLPDPATNYDPEREFSAAVYYFDNIHSGREDIPGSLAQGWRSRAQMQAELKNLYDHGIRRPSVLMAFGRYPGWDSWKKPQRVREVQEEHDLYVKQRLDLLREAGFSLKPLYLHTGGNLGFREFYNRAEHRKLLDRSIREGNAFYRKHLGHTDIYHYGLDEAEGDRLLAEYEVWEDMRARGAKVNVTLKKANVPLVAGRIDVAIVVHQPEKAVSKLMHDKGGRIWVYAQPFASNEEAYPHRKGYGFGVYFADYDGVCNYSFNHWQESPRRLPWRTDSGGAFYVFPTADGVADTPGWEGYREGIDDVRYATLLRREIAKALTGRYPEARSAAARAVGLARRAAGALSGNAAARRETAKAAAAFLEQVNIHAADFDPEWTRLQIIDWILDLIGEDA